MTFPVTYLIDRFAPSETFIQRELDQLRRRNWPIFSWTLKGGAETLPYALFSCPEGCRWRFFKAAFCRVLEELPRSPLTAWRIFHRLPQAANLVRKALDSESRLIHAQFAGITADIAGIVAKTIQIPWTCAVHAHDVFTCPPQQLYRRLRTATGIVACSHQAANAVLEAGISPENVTVIHHGLHLNDFVFDTIQPDGVLFTACRLDEKKGIDVLLHACAILRDRGHEFNCIIAGDGPLRHKLELLRNKLGLGDLVDFIGWQSQEETLLRLIDASLLVLPSRRTRDGDRDGIANILIESMALGTPILTTTAGAAAEIVIDTVNGMLVPPDDPERLAERIDQAFTSKEKLLHMAKLARETVSKDFDGNKNIQQTEIFFKRAATTSF